MHILLLEDDPILSDLMYDHLTENGYQTTLCMDGEEAITHLDSQLFDLLILDINVPGKNGIDVLTAARQYHKKTPAIFITAYQDIEHLKAGFQAGCDDYIKKPFALEELDTRIEHIKKRYHLQEQSLIPLSSDIRFDISKRQLHKSDGTTISLSHKEAQILHYFLNHRNRLISSEELTQNIWPYDEIPTDATLRVYIKNLRRHLGKERIKTIRGLGYSFEP
jgi:DNA-binding response OmpR family regulator